MTILRGLPGSGKTRFARSLHGIVVSADEFPGLYARDASGIPHLNPSLIGPAHAACFRNAIQALEADYSVIVDNTNLTVAEVAPYVLLAQAYGTKCDVVRLIANPETCFARQTHGVPRGFFDQMVKDHDADLRLPYWPCTFRTVQFE